MLLMYVHTYKFPFKHVYTKCMKLYIHKLHIYFKSVYMKLYKN